MRIGINGMGSVGRRLLRVALERGGFDVVACNSRGDPATIAHLLRYDSNYGRLEAPVEVERGALRVGDLCVATLREPNPGRIPWAELGVELVVECSGQFNDRATAARHLLGGAKRVIVSAPCRGADATVVMGVNHDACDPSRHRVISASSCTTTALAPLFDVLQREFGVRDALVTTVHAYTNDQSTLDTSHRDLRRARAAACNLVPSKTGAAEGVVELFPELRGRVTALAVRAPVPAVSLVEVAAHLDVPADAERINAALREAAHGRLAEALAVTDEPLVSSDFLGHPAGAIVDTSLTAAVEGGLARVVAWYDNEWGYASRLAALVAWVAAQSPAVGAAAGDDAGVPAALYAPVLRRPAID